LINLRNNYRLKITY